MNNIQFKVELRGVHLPDDIGYETMIELLQSVAGVLEDHLGLTNVKVEEITKRQ